MEAKRILVAVSLTCLFVVFGLAACSNDDPVAPESSALSSARAVNMVEPVEVAGEIGPGTLYRILVPANWNGDLILYAHGFKDVDDSIGLPTADDWPLLRERLLALGYATAASSFSENGLSLKDGVQRTHQLRGIFVFNFGDPRRTYLVGHSLGGAIAIALAEKFPQQYAGALPISGMIGGSTAQIDFVGNVRVLFDVCYGDQLLPGSVLDIPDNVDLTTDVIYPIAGAIQQNPECAFAITQIEQTPVPFTSPNELVQSFATIIAYNYRGFADIMGRTHRHTPFDNHDTAYSGPLPQEFLDGVNATVERYERTPDANAYLSHYFEPTGELEVPVVTLHAQWDPIVPVFHEEAYRQIVDAAGASDLLVQRIVPYYGHCQFADDDPASVDVVVQAFADLVNWVENGIKPAP